MTGKVVSIEGEDRDTARGEGGWCVRLEGEWEIGVSVGKVSRICRWRVAVEGAGGVGVGEKSSSSESRSVEESL